MPSNSESAHAVSPEFARDLRTRLCEWFAESKRDLPWRRTRDPYAIWISEAMLQQTRVETVIPYWNRFLERLPTVADLAAAEEAELLALWSGLGYYRRARSLRLAAVEIEARFEGQFPDLLEDALSLPGIGPYTAGAILSIAYDLPVAAVDGNVMRVFSRLFRLEDPWGSSALGRKNWKLAEELMVLATPQAHGRALGAGAWNQGLMELGATICTSAKPSCEICPLSANCAAFEAGAVEHHPVPGPPKQSLDVELEVLVIVRHGKLLIRQRPPGGRMADMLECPTRELVPTQSKHHQLRLFDSNFGDPAAGGKLETGRELVSIRHSITNHRIRAVVREGELELPKGARLASPWRWIPLDQLDSLALTGMTSKLLKREVVADLLSGAANR